MFEVTGLKGPLEEGWQKIVEAFVSQIPIPLNGAADEGHKELSGIISLSSSSPEGNGALEDDATLARYFFL